MISWLRGLWRRWRGLCPRCTGVLFVSVWRSSGYDLRPHRWWCPECKWGAKVLP